MLNLTTQIFPGYSFTADYDLSETYRTQS